MGWLRQAILVVIFGFMATLALSGCLLFTDPINKAPVVKITPPTGPIQRDVPAVFSANATDDVDSLATIHWAEISPINGGCTAIGATDWTTKSTKPPIDLATDAHYEFTAQSTDVVCLCARATDHQGATGQDCYRIAPLNAKLVAIITDLSGTPSGRSRPLYSYIHLSGDTSIRPAEDQVDFLWDDLHFDGTDPAGKAIDLAPCTDTPVSNPNHRCFYATVPGNYVARLTIVDKTTSSDASAPITSDPAVYQIAINVDTPPCLQRTDPEVHAQRILLSRATDLGGAYENRTFKVLSVADDGQPYPVPSDQHKTPPHFVWSIYDATQANPHWVLQTNSSDTFTVSQSLFPDVRPGDTVKVRLEVRDDLVQSFYQAGGAICTSAPDFCCDPGVCGGSNECLRWTTWTVQFQP